VDAPSETLDDGRLSDTGLANQHGVVFGTAAEDLLDALDKTLVPSADNAELKDLMVKVRPAFVAHLEHAKMLQSQLGK